MAKAVKAAILSVVDSAGEAPVDPIPAIIDPKDLFLPTLTSLQDGQRPSAITMPPSISVPADQLLHGALVYASTKIASPSSSSYSALEALLFAINGVADVEPSIKEEMLQQVLLEMLVGKSPPPDKYCYEAVASWVDKLLSSNQGEEEQLLDAADRMPFSDPGRHGRSPTVWSERSTSGRLRPWSLISISKRSPTLPSS